jgi:hypothetical protein
MNNDTTDIFEDFDDVSSVICTECGNSYASDFDDVTGVATTSCDICGHDQRDYVH